MSRPIGYFHETNLKSHIAYVRRPERRPRIVDVLIAAGVVVVAIGFWWVSGV